MIVLVIGLIAIGAGLICLAFNKIKAGNTEMFPAEVIGMREKTVTQNGTIQKVYCPVVKYKMYGTERTAEHYCYRKLADIKHSHNGESVTVFINRKKAKTFNFADEPLKAPAEGIVFIVCGVIMSALGIVMMIVS